MLVRVSNNKANPKGVGQFDLFEACSEVTACFDKLSMTIDVTLSLSKGEDFKLIHYQKNRFAWDTTYR